MSGFEGSMVGSGIYVADITTDFECGKCEKEFELDGYTNDQQTEANAECPDCGAVLTKEISTEQGTDEAYEAWCDSQDQIYG